MITLPDNMAIDADKYQFILKQERIREKGDRKGEPYWKDVGYYPTLSHLCTALFERRMYSLVSELNSLQDVQQELEKWARELKSPLLCDLREAVRGAGLSNAI